MNLAGTAAVAGMDLAGTAAVAGVGPASPALEGVPAEALACIHRLLADMGTSFQGRTDNPVVQSLLRQVLTQLQGEEVEGPCLVWPLGFRPSCVFCTAPFRPAGWVHSARDPGMCSDLVPPLTLQAPSPHPPSERTTDADLGFPLTPLEMCTIPVLKVGGGFTQMSLRRCFLPFASAGLMAMLCR